MLFHRPNYSIEPSIPNHSALDMNDCRHGATAGFTLGMICSSGGWS